MENRKGKINRASLHPDGVKVLVDGQTERFHPNGVKRLSAANKQSEPSSGWSEGAC
jgi:hypothetical protein